VQERVVDVFCQAAGGFDRAGLPETGSVDVSARHELAHACRRGEPLEVVDPRRSRWMSVADGGGTQGIEDVRDHPLVTVG
jgi:hypothetical protein